MASSAVRSITRSSATKASGSKPAPVPGLTDTRHGIIITLGSVFDTPPPLIGGGVRVCFFLCSPAQGLTSAVQSLIINTWKHSPLPLIGGVVKCFLFFAPAPLLYQAGRINSNTLSDFALGSRSWRYQMGRTAQDAPQGRMSRAHSQVCSDTTEARHTRRHGRTDARRGFPTLVPARGNLQHAAGSCSGAKEKHVSALDKSTERAV